MDIQVKNMGRADYTFYNDAKQVVIVRPGQSVTAQVDDYTGKLLQRMSADSFLKVGDDIPKAEEQRKAESEELRLAHQQAAMSTEETLARQREEEEARLAEESKRLQEEQDLLKGQQPEGGSGGHKRGR